MKRLSEFFLIESACYHKTKRREKIKGSRLAGLIPDTGFTLVELLISITIIGIMLVLLTGAFRLGARAWEKGDEGIELRQRIRAVLNLLNDQIISISLRETVGDNFFTGDLKSLEFISRKSLYPESDSGEIQVKYIVKKQSENEETLLLSEKKPLSVIETAASDKVEDEKLVELIPVAAAIEFEYLKKRGVEGAMEWQPGWDMKTDLGIPLAVRITLKETMTSSPIRVISRVIPRLNKKKLEQKQS